MHTTKLPQPADQTGQGETQLSARESWRMFEIMAE